METARDDDLEAQIDVEAFRASFPVLSRAVYLNAGTNGPVPAASVAAMADRASLEAREGGAGAGSRHALRELMDDARGRLARVFGADHEEIALTDSTTGGVNTILYAFPLRRGDEVITTDEEHPGVLAPLAAARRRVGIEIRVVPFDDIANAAGPHTRLVVCSHVSWMTGAVAPVEQLAQLEVPVLLDGAQGIGAVSVDVRELGCDFYAGSGQKWLCGPDGTGVLYVARQWLDDLALPWPSYGSLGDPGRPMELVAAEGARRFDLGIVPGSLCAGLIASLDTLEHVGWQAIYSRGRSMARLARERLSARVESVRGGHSTLVSWRTSNSAGVVNRLRAAGIVVRDIPGEGLVRGSFGAWTSEEDIDRLVEAVG